MTDLIATTALGAPAPRSATFGALRLAENPGLALASVARRRGAALPKPLGLSLPEPGYWQGGNVVSVFWAAPGQWMILAEGRADTDFALTVSQSAPDASVTEQTDGWVAFDLNAPAELIARLLEKLVNLPPEAVAPGRATRTVCDHMGIYVIRPTESHLLVLGMRSAAASLWHRLETVAARIGEIP